MALLFIEKIAPSIGWIVFWLNCHLLKIHDLNLHNFKCLLRASKLAQFQVSVARASHCTPHFNGKKLWNNSTWNFELIFHTMDINWLSPRQNFFHSSLVSRWRCDQFSKKCPKSKSDNTFTLKKPFVTPNFCKWNLSPMHHFRTVNYFTL